MFGIIFFLLKQLIFSYENVCKKLQIAKDKGYEHFIKDINRIIRECLNKDCKPIVCIFIFICRIKFLEWKIWGKQLKF